MYDMMMDKVVAKFGFEDTRTIEFFEMCETIGESDEALEFIMGEFNSLMDEPIF